MAYGEKTKGEQYTNRLVLLGSKRWKRLLNAQLPYKWNLLRLDPGKTLDVGCGFGRLLQFLPDGSVGVDHNTHSITKAQSLGLEAYTNAAFKKSKQAAKLGSYDSLLMGHLLEHLTVDESIALLIEYKAYLKPHGKLILICPQEKGFASDETHVTFMDQAKLSAIAKKAGFTPLSFQSFPFPRFVGKLFTYNEFVLVAEKSSAK